MIYNKNSLRFFWILISIAKLELISSLVTGLVTVQVILEGLAVNSYESRLETMRKMERNLKSNIITLIYNTSNTRFKTQFASDVLPSLNDLLKSIPVRRLKRSVTLVSHSSGGFMDVIGSFIYLIRKKFDEFQVAVPDISHSAATLLCFGADSILMSDLSSLSPVDPQVSLKTQAGMIGAGAEDIKGYYSLIDGMFKDDSAKIQAFNSLISRFPAEVLGQLERIQKQAEMVATKALRYHITEEEVIKDIVRKFQREFFSHNYRIHFDEAKKLGLKVQPMNKNIEILCSGLLKQYQSVSGNQADLEIEIPDESPYQEFIMNRAYLECLHSSFSYKTKYRVFKDKKVELEELGWSKN